VTVASAVTERAREFVSAHLPGARELGQRLAAELDDPSSFEAMLRQGLRELADPVYADAQAWITPGVGQVIGVRLPLIQAIEAELRGPLREASAGTALYLADHLSRAPEREVRLFAHVPLRRSLPDDPERSWQLIRRLARLATEWSSVDALAELVARGIRLEPYRWAEIEQLVYSPHRWERRLAGATLATLPYQLPIRERGHLANAPALEILETLIGDDEPDVQKALSWALRSWAGVDPAGVASFVERETDRAVHSADGHRAWVIRDALSALPADRAAGIRERLAGLRRRSGAPSTSRASEVARPFLAASPDAHRMAEPPLAR
jgi:3-methyladenine DNA glycosylase AlkD